MRKDSGPAPTEISRIPERARSLIQKVIQVACDHHVRMDEIVDSLDKLTPEETKATWSLLEENGGFAIISFCIVSPWLMDPARKNWPSFRAVVHGNQKLEVWANSMAGAHPLNVLSICLRLVRALSAIYGPPLLHGLIDLSHEISVEMFSMSRRMQEIGSAVVKFAQAEQEKAVVDELKKRGPEGIN